MRCGELLALRWEHVDLERSVTRLDMTKSGEARLVPLSSMAVEVLRSVPRDIGGAGFPVTRFAVAAAFPRTAGESSSITWLLA